MSQTFHHFSKGDDHIKIVKGQLVDQKKSFSLGQKVFGFEETEWRKYKRLLAHSEKYGVFDEEQLISQLLVTDFQVESKGTLFRMSGVGCVATAPAFRGRGTVRQLFEQTLPDLANDAVPLSFLAPFSYAFYEKFGYRQIFSKQVISIKRHQLKPANNLFQSERCTFAAGLSVMCSIYDALRSLSDFSIVREKWWWEYSFDRKEYYYNVIKNKENNPIGYVIYQRKHEELLIKDLMMIELEGLSSILHELFNQNEHSKQIVFRMPKDHIDFNYCLKEPLQKQELIPHMMGRIISFSDFIQKYSFEPSRIEQRFFLLCGR